MKYHNVFEVVINLPRDSVIFKNNSKVLRPNHSDNNAVFSRRAKYKIAK